jgi:hypothetical protein
MLDCDNTVTVSVKPVGKHLLIALHVLCTAHPSLLVVPHKRPKIERINTVLLHNGGRRS